MVVTLIILYLVNVLDVVSTYLSGLNGGVEINPLVNMILNTGGYWLFSTVKVLSMVIITIFLLYVSKIPHKTINFKRATIIATSVFNAFMLYVVINNFYIAFAN
jgi:hypothetical protein